MTTVKETPVITWSNPADMVYGTLLGATQLNATANVSGTFAYTPAAGALLQAGARTLSVLFTPDDGAHYTTGDRGVTLMVLQATPVITWADPASIVYGTALGAMQLNATANVPGTFVYKPAAGTVPNAGTQPLAVLFTPADAVNYSTATAGVNILVTQAAPVITRPAPAGIGTAPLGAAQLNATASTAGAFVYSQPAGTILERGQPFAGRRLHPDRHGQLHYGDGERPVDRLPGHPHHHVGLAGSDPAPDAARGVTTECYGERRGILRLLARRGHRAWHRGRAGVAGVLHAVGRDQLRVGDENHDD
ncbi:MAG: hypothetical protein MZV64_42930 [Ignavibacteriales bacterium]|nr:hypothetical protein [Ignavibacteriales bacterium]